MFQIVLSINKPYILRKINLINQITIKVAGTGQKNILNSNFYYLPNKIIINGVNQNSISYSYNLEEEQNIINMIWNNPIPTCSYMFNKVSDLTEVDLTNFDSSAVESTWDMFYYCTSLTSINFQNFDTSKVTDFSFMFESCTKLTSIDLSGFVTTSAKDTYGMFNKCTSLRSIDLSNFDTSLVTDMTFMFCDIGL